MTMHIHDKVKGILKIREEVIKQLFSNFDHDSAVAYQVEALISTYVLAVVTRDITISEVTVVKAEV